MAPEGLRPTGPPAPRGTAARAPTSKAAQAAGTAAALLCLVAGGWNPAALARPVTLWVPARGGYLNDWRQAAALAARLDPGITVTVQPIWADDLARLTLALAEGRGPDLAVVSPEVGARLASRGWLEEVTGQASRRGLAPSAAAPFAWQGRIYAVPGFADPAVLYANLDLLARAGRQPPDDRWDWHRLLSAARAVAQAAGAAEAPPTGVPWGFPVNGWPPLDLFVWQAGGWVVEPPNRLWDDPAPLARAARFYRSFVTEHLSPRPPLSWAQPLDGSFRNGMAALMVGLYSHRLETPAAREAAFAAAVAPLPRGPDGLRAGWMWVEGLAVPRPASPDALRALAALTRALHALGPLPPTARRPGADGVALDELAHARTLPGLPAYLEFSAAWWEHVVVPLLTGPEPLNVEELLRQARGVLQQVLHQGIPLPPP